MKAYSDLVKPVPSNLCRPKCTLFHSTWSNSNHIIIANNTASYDGGGIYLRDYATLTMHSHSTLQILENRATDNGGGIYISDFSSINLAFKSSINKSDQTSNSMINFRKNKASKGGGLYFGFNSTVLTFMCLNNTISFDENSAEYGGAVYVFSKLPISSYPECFFQSLPHPVLMYNIDDTITCSKHDDFPFQFSLNRAYYSGISLFKSAFDKCLINGRLLEEFVVVNSLSNVQASDVGSFQVLGRYAIVKMGILTAPSIYNSLILKLGKK